MKSICKIYKNARGKGFLTPSLSGELEFQIDIMGENEVLRPVILLKSDNNLSGYNYIYLEGFQKYYFCEISVVRDNLYRISCSIDALYSNKNAILGLEVVVDRQESLANAYIVDSSYQSINKTQTVCKKFPKSFGKAISNILVISGGN